MTSIILPLTYPSARHIVGTQYLFVELNYLNPYHSAGMFTDPWNFLFHRIWTCFFSPWYYGICLFWLKLHNASALLGIILLGELHVSWATCQKESSVMSRFGIPAGQRIVFSLSAIRRWREPRAAGLCLESWRVRGVSCSQITGQFLFILLLVLAVS